MKQAKVPNETEMKRLLAVIEAGKHASRNRVAVMLSHLAGMRVGEIAALTIGDVYDADGNAREHIMLKAAYTKGNHARTAFVSENRECPSFQREVLYGSIPLVGLLGTITLNDIYKLGCPAALADQEPNVLDGDIKALLKIAPKKRVGLVSADRR